MVFTMTTAQGQLIKNNMFANLNTETRIRRENVKKQQAIKDKIDSGMHNEETLASLNAELDELKKEHPDLTFDQAFMHPADFNASKKEEL